MIPNPWDVLCVDVIGPYTLKDKHKIEIDFMCLTLIDQATSRLEIVEMPVVDKSTIPTSRRGRNGISTHNAPKVPYFDKSLVPW